jgi:hypothetical protein
MAQRGKRPRRSEVEASPCAAAALPDKALEGDFCALCGGSYGRSCIEGRLLGPFRPKAPAKRPIYVHEQCLYFSAECQGHKSLASDLVGAVVRRGRSIRCRICHAPGATITCAQRVPRTCWTYFHYRCAVLAGAVVSLPRRLVFCARHRLAAAEQGLFRQHELLCHDVPPAEWLEPCDKCKSATAPWPAVSPRLSCHSCGCTAHVHCLQRKQRLPSGYTQSAGRWQCPDCIRCGKCAETFLCEEWKASWTCAQCLQHFHARCVSRGQRGGSKSTITCKSCEQESTSGGEAGIGHSSPSKQGIIPRSSPEGSVRSFISSEAKRSSRQVMAPQASMIAAVRQQGALRVPQQRSSRHCAANTLRDKRKSPKVVDRAARVSERRSAHSHKRPGTKANMDRETSLVAETPLRMRSEVQIMTRRPYQRTVGNAENQETASVQASPERDLDGQVDTGLDEAQNIVPQREHQKSNLVRHCTRAHRPVAGRGKRAKTKHGHIAHKEYAASFPDKTHANDDSEMRDVSMIIDFEDGTTNARQLAVASAATHRVARLASSLSSPRIGADQSAALDASRTVESTVTLGNSQTTFKKSNEQFEQDDRVVSSKAVERDSAVYHGRDLGHDAMVADRKEQTSVLSERYRKSSRSRTMRVREHAGHGYDRQNESIHRQVSSDRQRSRQNEKNIVYTEGDCLAWSLAEELHFGNLEPRSWALFFEQSLQLLEQHWRQQSLSHKKNEMPPRSSQNSGKQSLAGNTNQQTCSLPLLTSQLASNGCLEKHTTDSITPSNPPACSFSRASSVAVTTAIRLSLEEHRSGEGNSTATFTESIQLLASAGMLDWGAPKHDVLEQLIPCRIALPLDMDLCCICHSSVKASSENSLFCWCCGESFHASCLRICEWPMTAVFGARQPSMQMLAHCPCCWLVFEQGDRSSLPSAEAKPNRSENLNGMAEHDCWQGFATSHSTLVMPSRNHGHCLQEHNGSMAGGKAAEQKNHVKRPKIVHVTDQSVHSSGLKPWRNTNIPSSGKEQLGRATEHVAETDAHPSRCASHLLVSGQDPAVTANKLSANSVGYSLDDTVTSSAGQDDGKLRANSVGYSLDDTVTSSAGQDDVLAVRVDGSEAVTAKLHCLLCSDALDIALLASYGTLLCRSCTEAAAKLVTAIPSEAHTAIPGCNRSISRDRAVVRSLPSPEASYGEAENDWVQKSILQLSDGQDRRLSGDALIEESEAASNPVVGPEAADSTHLGPRASPFDHLFGTKRSFLDSQGVAPASPRPYKDALPDLKTTLAASHPMQQEHCQWKKQKTGAALPLHDLPCPDRGTEPRLSAYLQDEVLLWPALCSVPDPRRCALCGRAENESTARLGGLIPVIRQHESYQWVHAACLFHCTHWGPNLICILQAAQTRRCAVCHEYGASILCAYVTCTKAFHRPCAESAQGLETLPDRLLCWCSDHRGLLASPSHPTTIASNNAMADWSSAWLLPRVAKPPRPFSKPALRVGAWTLLDYGNCRLQASPVEDEALPPDAYAARCFWSLTTPFHRTIYFLSHTRTDTDEDTYALRALDNPKLCLIGSKPVDVWRQLMDRLLSCRSSLSLPVPNCLCPRTEQEAAAQRFFCPVPALVHSLAVLGAPDRSHREPYSSVEISRETTQQAISTGAARCHPYERQSDAVKWTSLGAVHRFVDAFQNGQQPLNLSTSREVTATTITVANRRMPETLSSLGNNPSVPKRSATRAIPATAAERRQYRQMQLEHRQYCVPLRSRIHGFGLFALRDLEPDQMIIEYAGEQIPSPVADVRERHYDRRGIGCYMFRIDADWVVDATMSGSVARFINHACRPNCYSEILRMSDEPGHDVIVIRSARAIRRGEELTYNYMFDLENASKIPCYCGDKDCVGFMN